MTLNLQSLITAAKAKVVAAESLKATVAHSKLAKTDTARASAQSEVDSLRAILDWHLDAVVLVFDAWECKCGRKGRAPQGTFLSYSHVRLANTTRMTAIPANSTPPSEPPRRITDRPRFVTVCQRCAVSCGFPAPLTNVTR